MSFGATSWWNICSIACCNIVSFISLHPTHSTEIITVRRTWISNKFQWHTAHSCHKKSNGKITFLWKSPLCNAVLNKTTYFSLLNTSFLILLLCQKRWRKKFAVWVPTCHTIISLSAYFPSAKLIIRLSKRGHESKIGNYYKVSFVGRAGNKISIDGVASIHGMTSH